MGKGIAIPGIVDPGRESCLVRGGMELVSSSLSRERERRVGFVELELLEPHKFRSLKVPSE